MSGTTNTMHIDYREAFVIDMEMAAHGLICKTCIVAALNGKPEESCVRMNHMRGYIKQAYEALPPYYKQRYTEATSSALAISQEATKGLVGGR